MSVHLRNDLERLKQRLLSQCVLVEGRVQAAVHAFLQRDLELAHRVIDGDAEVDRCEVELEEECLKTFALHQPVANDLRMVVATLKINTDLERVGDLAVNIARKAAAAATERPLHVSVDILTMSQKTQAMLRDSIDALFSADGQLARAVCRRDDEIDRLKQECRGVVEVLIAAEPQRAAALLRLLAVCRNLERIADAASNIAEDAIFMAEGQIIRHGWSGDRLCEPRRLQRDSACVPAGQRLPESEPMLAPIDELRKGSDL
jgi:phosphate transport system protein